MKKKNRIYYFVDDIGTSFVIKDIQILAREYENIYLFSIDFLEGKETLPANVHVIENFMDWKRYNKFNILALNCLKIFQIYLFEFFKSKRVISIKKSLALLCSNIFKASEINRHFKTLQILPEASDIYYSFWFYDCIYLAWLKMKNRHLNVITRTHSGDLYEDHISIRDKLLYRNYQMKYLDAVFPVSNMGTAYLQDKYPLHKDKYKTILLGTEDRYVLNPFDIDKFVIVSCASFRHHKRIHKIAESLLEVNFPITWYHFGNENLHTNDPKIQEYIELKEQLKLNSNINYIPMGYTENKDLLDFYTTNQVNLFISLSAAEGIPVSIMEAISFGIPVLSTDVGGCSEIVNAQTGILIPLETSTKEIAKLLFDFRSSNKNTFKFRSDVRNYWYDNFDENKNYKKFLNELDKIIK